MQIYVDGDACPVKDEVIRVAERHRIGVRMVSNKGLFRHAHPLVEPVMVAPGLDVADDWIAGHIGAGDIAVTSDIPLAGRCVAAGALVVTPTGRLYDARNIGMAMASRDLMTHLREAGTVTSRTASFSKRDRSSFLEALERAVQAQKRATP